MILKFCAKMKEMKRNGKNVKICHEIVQRASQISKPSH